MKKILFAFLLLIISNKSFSQSDDEFQYVGESVNGDEVYIHFEKENYGTKEFWIKWILPVKSTKNKNGKIIKSGGGYVLEYCKIDCSEKTYSISDTIKYDKNGNVIANNYSETYQQKVVPGSMMNGIHRFICENE
jgi:hypothetical protein